MDRADIKKIKSGGIWTALGATAAIISQIGIIISLAAFFGPTEVGQFSVFLFVLSLVLTIAPFGNDFAFVQSEELARADFLRVVAVGACATILVSLIVFSISNIFIESIGHLSSAIIFGCIAGFMESAVLVSSAILQRNLNYRTIESANILRNFLTFILSILSLFIFMSIESVFLSRIISNIICLFIISKPVLSDLLPGRPRQPFCSYVARDMLLKNVLNHISRNAEVFAALPQLGTAGLGVYDFGRRIIAQPRDLIGSVLFKFTYPMFAKIHNIDNISVRNRFMRRAYKNSVSAAAYFGFPIFALTLLISDPLIVHLFGEEWSPAVPVVNVFAITAFIQVLGNNIITSALTATGGSGIVLKAEYALFIPRILAVYVSSFYGPTTIAIAIAFFIIFKLLWMQIELNKITNLDFGLIAKASRYPAYAALLGFVIAAPTRLVLQNLYYVIAGGLLFLLVYAAVTTKLMHLGYIFPSSVKKMIRRRIKS